MRASAYPGWIPAAFLLLLAGVLRFYQLDSQLWLDEISALLRSYRMPLLQIATQFPGFIPDPLYGLLARISVVVLGESPVAIRLPAALFGIAGVMAFYALAMRLGDAQEAFLAGGLLAVSYHHVWFSQNARGYTVMVFWMLVATVLMVSLIQRFDWRRAAGYIGAAAMTAYANPFGAFVPVGQGMVAGVVSLARRGGASRGTPTPAQVVAVVGLTLVAILILFAPFLRDSMNFSMTTGRVAAHGPRVAGVVYEIFEGLRAALFGWKGVIVAAVVGGIGLIDYVRRQPVALGLLLLPVLVAALAAGLMGVGVHARYFLIMLPTGYLVGTRGLVVIVKAVLRQGLGLSSHSAAVAHAVVTVLIIAVAAVPLSRYYAFPKQDFEGAIREATVLAGPGGRAVAATQAANAIRDYYAPEFPVVADLDALLREEGAGRRTVVVTTLERVMAADKPDLLEHLRRDYTLARVLPGTLGDGAMRIYVREAPPR
jgi:hypothetical protein